MATGAPRHALGQLGANAFHRGAQLDKARDVAGLQLSVQVIRVDRANIVVPAVETALLLPLIDYPLEAAAGPPQFHSRATFTTASTLMLESLGAVLRVGPALLVATLRRGKRLRGLSRDRLGLAADAGEPADSAGLSVEG
jgi:hypothetical protein